MPQGAGDADHVHDHCLAVLREPSAAAACAVGALGVAGRGRAAALAAARIAAVAAPSGSAATPQPVDTAVPSDLVELAWLLGATRPAEERSTADLLTRHGLDRAALGRALDRPPGPAAEEAAAVLARWDDAFGPVLLTFLGPGDCAALAGVLAVEGVATDGTGTIGGLQDAAGVVAEHVAGCEVCADRERAVPPVRTLLAQVPLAPAPAAVRAAPRGRTRPIRATVAGRRPARRATVVAVACAVVAVLAGAVVWAAVDGGRSGDESAVAALTELPAANALSLSPASVRPGEAVVVRNGGGDRMRWRATTGQPWLVASPDTGMLAPGDTASIVVRAGDGAPEGDLRAAVTVTGADGSTAMAAVEGSVDHPPTVAATLGGCAVRASAQDDGAVASVALHWRGRRAGSAMLAPAPAGWVGSVPSDAGATAWWVVAVDGRGNRASTPERPVPSGSCAPSTP